MTIRIKTNKGDIHIELYQDKAPETVSNFMQYVNDGHYDNTIFHRVIRNFMIQGGGFDREMRLQPTRGGIRNEANNGLSNELGTIAMARTADPHSAAAQFFVNTDDNPFLDFQKETADGWGYCVFGKVVDGMDVVYAIEDVLTGTRDGHEDVPEEPIIIQKMALLEG